jgi:hypothetical protein
MPKNINVAVSPVSEREINILPSRKLKDAPLKKHLAWSCFGTIQRVSGIVLRNQVRVQLIRGFGPNDQKPGDLFYLPASEVVGLLKMPPK